MQSARVVSLTLIALASIAWSAATLAQPALPSPSTRPATTQSAGRRAAVVAIEGEIDESTARYLVKQVQAARAAGADTVILKLNTPGGLVISTLRMTQFLRERAGVHTVAYIEFAAWSGGTITALACDELVMEKGSQLGDAAPIQPGNYNMGKTERGKAEGPVQADLAASASRNGYDTLLLGAFVTLERVVHYVQAPDGTRRFVEPDEYGRLTAQGWKPVAGVKDPLDRADELLTMDSGAAQLVGLSRGSYSSLDEFVAERQYQIISTVEPSSGQTILRILGNVWIHGILLTIFLQALYIALSHPGHGMAEVVALVALSILIVVPLMTGYATWWEVAMILLGILLLALEVFVIPGFGFTGITGIILILGGFVLTFVPQEPNIPGILPRLPQTWAYLKQGVVVVTAGLGCSLFLWIWLQRYLPKLPYFNRLILTATSGGEGLGVPVVASEPVKVWPPVGASGSAVTDLKPGGAAEFDDPAIGATRVVDVLSESGYLKPGERVVVKENVGMRIVVRKASGVG